MIRIAPYYEYEPHSRRKFQQAYLRMIAASTPFLAEDVLYDDREGLDSCNKSKSPKRRTSKIKSLLDAHKIQDGADTSGRLLADALLAKAVIQDYSKKLHDFIYEGQTASTGHVNRENLRSLLLLRLDKNGQLPEGYRFNENRTGTDTEQKESAKALYEYVFRYDVFSQLKTTTWHCGIHELVATLGVKVCPYCNRLFTTTVNAKGHRVRPQLDHFKNKSDYPFLALSINNLVPSCGVCNLLKSNKDDGFVYPYAEGFAENLVFRTNIPADHTVPALEGIPIAEDDFQIELEFNDSVELEEDRRSRIQTSKEQLALAEVYQSHRDYVAFLYRQRYIFTKQLAEDLYKQFGERPGEQSGEQSGELFSSVEEIEAVFVLMYTDEGRWGDRPLSKLTHDILDEIDGLYVGWGEWADGH